MLPYKLKQKLQKRTDENSLRQLSATNRLIDFSSNDYLGFSTNKAIFHRASEILKLHNLLINGATGSRLLSGNHAIYEETESSIASFHHSTAALIFNSGYDANIGLLSSIPQRGDIIIYDELCHASIRDGIKMSNAKAFKFKHNDLQELEKLLSVRAPSRTTSEEQYVITESIFSMDGDQPDLKTLTKLCKKYNAHLIIDEAHAIGVCGTKGEGLVAHLGLENDVFARVITFGKALGCHGAAILGNKELKTFLVNFARSFVYTTALPPHSVATIQAAYDALKSNSETSNALKSNIAILQNMITAQNLNNYFIPNESAIQSCIIKGNSHVKKISEVLRKKGFDVKPILSPTVPEGQERLRICVHSFNSKEEIKSLVTIIKEHITEPSPF